MLRALLITLAILAAALGGYLYWLHRTHAYMHVRSLSAAPTRHDGQTKTRMLVVPGCERSFLVKVGELVEPEITPATTLSAEPDALRAATLLYGKPTHEHHPEMLVWKQDAFTLAEPLARESIAASALSGSLELTINTGHVVQTLDDIELGIDSFNAIRTKMRDRNLPVSDQLVHGKDFWTYRLTIPSSCGPKWSSTYTRTLPETPELDAQILPPAGAADHAPRAAAFFNKLATKYTLTRVEPAQ